MRLLSMLALVASALAGASAASECAFVGSAIARPAVRAQVSSPASAVQMRGAVKSTKKKGAKVRSAVAKRMKVTAGGKVLRRRANKQHLLTAKTHKNKKKASKIGQVNSDTMAATYRSILGH